MSLTAPTKTQPDNPSGVLLYYKYVPLQEGAAEDVAAFYKQLCSRLDLRGRIRVARDGVNVTVGGPLSALHAHADAVTAHPVLQGGDIDFKLAVSDGARNEATRAETHMDRLVVRLCEELVTLGPLARHRADPWVSTAPHLTPEQFHQMLQRANTAAPPPAAADVAAAEPAVKAAAAAQPEPVATRAATQPPSPPPQPPTLEADYPTTANDASENSTASPLPSSASWCDAAVERGGGGSAGSGGEAVDRSRPGSGGGGGGSVVLLDARNIYETRIGHFDGGPSVLTLDPRTRCFSDLPAWLDAHEALLRNRTVLMYCTGGVRCERASAYLREKGPEFGAVYQLSGGIQRYLERFPDGGFFRGKNFLYDDRIAVGPQGAVRQQEATAGAAAAPTPAAPSSSPCSSSAAAVVVGRCLLCGCAWDDYGARLRCSRCRLLVLVCDDCSAALTHGSPRLLCELCSSTVPAAAAVNGIPDSAAAAANAGPGPSPPSPAAPTPGGSVGNGGSSQRAQGEHRSGHPRGGEGPAAAATAAVGAAVAPAGGGAPRRLRILCLHGFRQTGKQFQGRTCALRKKLRDQADFVFVDAPHALPFFVKAAAGGSSGGGGGNGGGAAAAPAEAADDTDAAHDVDVAEGEGGAADGGDTDACAARSSGCSPRAITGPPALTSGACGSAEASGEGGGDAAAVAAQVERRRGGRGEAGAAEAAGPPPPRAAKRAWLLPPELHCEPAPAEAAEAPGAGTAPPGPGDGWRDAPSYVDEMQYMRQTEGWRESLAAVHAAVLQQGPFDGVFGFSQGAAVAAVLCALQQMQRTSCQRREQQRPEHLGTGADGHREADTDTDTHAEAGACDCGCGCDFGFRFAILASGFLSPLPQHRALLAAVGPLELPSLHVYGSTGTGACPDGADRQICPRESEALAAAFSCADGRRRCLCHQSGHLIPATKSHAATFRAFLAQFTDERTAQHHNPWTHPLPLLPP